MFEYSNQILYQEKKVVAETLFTFLLKYEASNKIKEMIYQTFTNNQEYLLPASFEYRVSTYKDNRPTESVTWLSSSLSFSLFCICSIKTF